MPINQRRWSRTGLLFLAAVIVYALLTFLGWLVGAVVVKKFPENFEWQVHKALAQGNYERAVKIAQRRVEAEHYDFAAHRLLASVLLAMNKPAEAVATLEMSVDRMASATDRDVYTLGADPAATYNLLAKALEQQGRSQYAAAAHQIAEDYSNLSTVSDSVSTATTSDISAVAPPSLTKSAPVDMRSFILSGDVVYTTSGTLHFTGRGRAEVDLKPEVSVASTAFLRVSGGSAFGIGSILKVKVGEHPGLRAYVNSTEERWVSLPLPKHDSVSSLPLTLEFINDAYDAVTNSDRNIEVFELRLQ